jgi:2,4-dienoyl-CoA reductase-like NADH-dependent reductase (Old Yellow Enzyme family)
MEIEDIVEVEEAFRRAARYARTAGFDGIEVHASTGYLMEEFLSPYSNKRQDHYGGSLENRCRFLFEVLDAVRTAWEGQPLILGVKLTVRQRVPGGLTLDEGTEIAYKLDQEKSVDSACILRSVSWYRKRAKLSAV